MKKVFNKKIMKLIAESQEFGIDDKLTDVLNSDGELSEDDLFLVSAASGADKDRLKKIMEAGKTSKYYIEGKSNR